MEPVNSASMNLDRPPDPYNSIRSENVQNSPVHSEGFHTPQSSNTSSFVPPPVPDSSIRALRNKVKEMKVKDLNALKMNKSVGKRKSASKKTSGFPDSSAHSKKNRSVMSSASESVADLSEYNEDAMENEVIEEDMINGDNTENAETTGVNTGQGIGIDSADQSPPAVVSDNMQYGANTDGMFPNFNFNFKYMPPTSEMHYDENGYTSSKADVNGLNGNFGQNMSRNFGQTENVNMKAGQSEYVNMNTGQSEYVNMSRNFGQTENVNMNTGQPEYVNMNTGQPEYVNMNTGQSENANGKDDVKTTGAVPNVWMNKGMTFAARFKMENETDEIKMDFTPPVVMPDGKRRVCFSAEEILKGGSPFALQLYGYFVGTSMDFRVINSHLRRMWRAYDFKEVIKTSAGFYLCKFKSELGMRTVLESGPWLIGNVPFFIHQWEPGVWLEKIEPHKVPLWISIHNIPIELWSGKGIGKLASCIGKPLIMDKITRERCISKSGRMGFARVLVEVEANSELPDNVEFSYEAVGSFPTRVGNLNVTYQWKPPVCTHCQVFGHAVKVCKVRPRTEEEIEEQERKEKNKVNGQTEGEKQGNVNGDDNDFIKVGKKNKPVRNGMDGNRGNTGGNQNQRNNNVFSKANEVQQFHKKQMERAYQNINNNKQQRGSGMGDQKQTVGDSPKGNAGKSQQMKQEFVIKNDMRNKGKDKIDEAEIVREKVETSNKFSSLEGLNEQGNEFWDKKDKIWNSEKEIVIGFFRSKVNPPSSVKCKWSNAMREYFTANCHMYGIVEDPDPDEEDVASECDGMASNMKVDVDQGLKTDVGMSDAFNGLK